MKAKIKIAVFMLAALFLTVGCDSSLFPRSGNSDRNNDVYLDIVECGKFNVTETEFVSWCLTPYVVSKNSENVLRLENHTKRGLSYGVAFSLEYFSRGEWILVQLTDWGWELVGLGLLPGETDEGSRFSQIPLYLLVEKFNNSKKGKYRIGRYYTIHSDIPMFYYNREFSFKLYFEFVIK